MAQIDIDYKGFLIVVAVGLSVVAIGAIADFLVKRNEIKWLHGKFLRLSEALANIPLREWQVKIAIVGIKVVKSADEVGLRCLGFPDKLLKSAFARVLPSGSIHPRVFLFIILIFFLVYELVVVGAIYIYESTVLFVVFGIAALLLLQWNYWSIHPKILCGVAWWFIIVKVMSYSFWRGTAWILSAPVFLIAGILACSVPYSYRLVKKRDSNVGLMMMNIMFIHVVLSFVAITFAFGFIPLSLVNSDWYYSYNGGALPSAIHNIIPLYILNFLFDFFTLIMSVLLLKLVVRYRRFIGVVAVVDIVISAILTVTLYSFLLVKENGWDFLHFNVYFADSLHWFKDVIVGIYQADKYNEPWAKHLAGLRDIHLLPLLLTTFVPVALYMSVFILISFCKPVLKLASRIFGAVGEKEESVFKQFGFLIAAIMAAVKAIYEVLTL